MKIASLATLLLVCSGLLIFASCSEENCDCDDDTADDDAPDDDDVDADDDGDDDAGADDDSADDDTFGTGPGAEECLDALKPPFDECKVGCDEREEFCDDFHCLIGCFVDLFDGAVDCSEIYPELAEQAVYWQCMAECDSAFVTCLEPLEDCDLDKGFLCMDVMQTCESGCSQAPL
ncbi:MAG: hypothetical protein IT350_11340 [Deltaproteobacteria bacterium]|nr:hypothetical protein [Deltaproteobacteria bacterium]